MSGFIFVAAIVILGVILTGNATSKNGKSRILKQISILQGARRNEDVLGLLDLLKQVYNMPLAKEQHTRIAHIVDSFIGGNDITAAKSVKEHIERILNAEPSKPAQAPSYSKSSTNRLSTLIKRMESIKNVNSDIEELKTLLNKLPADTLSSSDREELSSIVISVLNAANTERNAAAVKAVTASSLIKAKAICEKNYAESVKNVERHLTKNEKPDNTINNIVPKTTKEKAVDVTKAEPTSIASKQPQTMVSPIPAASLQDTIAAINAAKSNFTEKRLDEYVDHILLLLNEMPAANGAAAASYSRYLISMLNELAIRPAYAQMAAMIVAANMLGVYQTLAEGAGIDMENAEKMIRIDLYMRSFSLEALSL
ncbi:MAG: hypothetical protein LBV04_03715 [Deferribacteraceae bacterium]|nr:hypothetical protein [Deferribacteraceae bacterium]